MFEDFKAASFWREEDLAADALKIRRESGYKDNQFSFDVFECLSRLPFTRKVLIRFFDAGECSKPAFVKFDAQSRATLNFAQWVPEAASKGDGYARVITIHEASHLRLHSYGLSGFSDKYDSRLHSEEWSVEWQAITWTKFFLLPDSVVKNFGAPEQIAEMCNVDLPTASSRWNQLREVERRQALSGLCPSCGGMSIDAERGRLACKECSWKSVPVLRS
jgi:hypothetical protein